MLLKPAPVSTRQLSYSRTQNKFIGEISDTHGFGRVWDDACDDGLTLVSHVTGTEVVFVVTYVHRNVDGDITHWDLRAATPGHSETMVLFND